jgi:glycolate oxidase FAD binding subunit
MTTAECIREALLAVPRARAVGARTKPGLSAAQEGVTAIEVAGHRGMVEYDPGEFTFTAKAGTPLREIAAELAGNGQFLPFDPPLLEAGATLGGTIAAGVNGPGRLRFGGMRDFILGVTFLTGDGRLVHGGGKVVKNAAGFDFPKLLVGSCGRLGVILEATFKVFPKPRAMLTAEARCESLAAAVDLAGRIGRLPADLEALELDPPGRVLARLAGDASTLPARLGRLNEESGAGFVQTDESVWQTYAAQLPVKVPITLPQVLSLDAALQSRGIARRYSVAGNVALLSGPWAEIDAVLLAQQLPGLSLGEAPARIGAWPDPAGERLVAGVLDPSSRLV